MARTLLQTYIRFEKDSQTLCSSFTAFYFKFSFANLYLLLEDFWLKKYENLMTYTWSSSQYEHEAYTERMSTSNIGASGVQSHKAWKNVDETVFFFNAINQRYINCSRIFGYHTVWQHIGSWLYQFNKKKLFLTLLFAPSFPLLFLKRNVIKNSPKCLI